RLIGGTMLTQVTSYHVQGLYGTVKREGASDRTRQLAHAVLHRALQAAVKAKSAKIPFNPCDYVEAPKLPKEKVHRVEPYSEEEVQRLLDAARGSRLEALIVLAVFSGMRQGELFALRWPDLDLASGSLCVRFSLEEINGRLSLKAPKSGQTRRVELPPLAVAALWAHRARMLAEGHLESPGVCDTHGRGLRKSNFLRNVFQPLLKMTGLPRRRFHDLRHTSATLLLRLGVHPKVVQERLGHSKIAVTLDTYSHVVPTLQKEAATKLEGLFRKSG